MLSKYSKLQHNDECSGCSVDAALLKTGADHHDMSKGNVQNIYIYKIWNAIFMTSCSWRTGPQPDIYFPKSIFILKVMTK